jgi:hypothetical protein
MDLMQPSHRLALASRYARRRCRLTLFISAVATALDDAHNRGGDGNLTTEKYEHEAVSSFLHNQTRLPARVNKTQGQ